jgi:small subunit ribosomal protein S20
MVKYLLKNLYSVNMLINMPITRSAKKALRQNKRRRQRNLRQLNALKDTVKKIKKLVAENKKEEALKLLPQTYKVIDKTAKIGIIKRNNAARKKSRLTKIISRGSSETAPKQS